MMRAQFNPFKIDVDQTVKFLVDLLNTPSPTGDTENAINFVKDAFRDLPFEMEISPKGTLFGTWKGEASDAPRAVTAHVDTLGAMVSRIKRNGRLEVTQLGGWVWTSVEGEGVTIFASDGKSYRGSMLPTTASVHAHTREESYAKRHARNMEVRVDLPVSAENTPIKVGDIVAFDPRVELSEHGYIKSRHLDDKAGVASIFGAINALHKAGLKPKQDTTIHISNYEEVGHGGGSGFPSDLAELVTVDMAVVAPGQRSNEFCVTICAKDSRGPYHMGLRRKLEKISAEYNIRSVTDIYPYYGSDGEAYWRAGGAAAVALIGPGVDASHHYERTHVDAIRNSAELIAAYLLS